MENPNRKFPAEDKKYISLHTPNGRDSIQLKQKTEGKFGTEGWVFKRKASTLLINKLDIKLSNTVLV